MMLWSAKPVSYRAILFVRGMSTMAGLAEQKALLRKRIRAELNKLTSDEIERQSAIITNKILQSPIYQNAKSVAIFLSMPGREVSTRDIVLQAFRDGKDVFVPYLHPGTAPKSKVMDMLQLQGEEDFKSLQPDAWGIPSLSEDTISHRRNALGGVGLQNEPGDHQNGPPKLNVIFMPAVAFDQTLQRLGHGKGFYDRYLHAYKTQIESSQPRGQMPYLVGLALQQQLLQPDEIVPTNDDDWQVDQVFTADQN